MPITSPDSRQRWHQHSALRAPFRLLLAITLLAGSGQAATARTLSYRGLIELDHGSSIPGIPSNSRYVVDFSLDGSLHDTEHYARENSFFNGNGVLGITTEAYFAQPFRSLSFTADPTGPSTADLSGLIFDYATRGTAIVKDANQPPDPDPVLCGINPCANEHFHLQMTSESGSGPVHLIFFNFYNSTMFFPNGTRQLILDTSQPGSDFSLEDLFLHGPETLAEFRSYRTPNFQGLVDGVMLTGPSGSVASGRFSTLAYVPPAPGPLPWLGASVALGWSRSLRRRIRGRASHAPCSGKVD